MDLHIQKPLELGSPAGGETGFVLVQAREGTHQLIFSLDSANDLILALQMAKKAIRDERRKAGKPPLRSAVVKPIEQIEYGMDPLNQVALLRTGFQDGSTQDLPISRTQIPEIMNFLRQAQQNFQAQDRARKQ
jgi:hypothetical protein